MDINQEYVFADTVKFLKKDDMVIVANGRNGQWIKLTQECLDIVLYGINNHLSLSTLLEALADDEDRSYIKLLFEKLIKFNAIKNKNDKDELKLDIDFEVSNQCNLNCIHCCIDADSSRTSQILSIEKMIEIINKIIKVNPKSITFTGGEPLLREDFLELLTYTKNHYSGDIDLMTNGTLISENNVDCLIKCLHRIDISIDGVNEETCSELRGTGVFEKVITNIKLLKSKGFEHITLSMVITDKTQNYRDEFMKLNEKLGTTPITRKFSATGRGEANKEQLVGNLEKREKILSQESHLKIFTDDERSDAYDSIKCSTCGALSRQLYINYKGEVYPCGLFEEKKFCLGHIDNIEDIQAYYDNKLYRCSPAYNELMNAFPENAGKCKDCDINLFCWNCIYYMQEVKDKKDLEKRCRIIKPEIEELLWND